MQRMATPTAGKLSGGRAKFSQAGGPARSPPELRVAAASRCQQQEAVTAAAPASLDLQRRRALAATALLPLGMLAQQLAAPLQAVAAEGDEPKFSKTPGGVLVQVLAEGSGPSPSPGDRVLVDYVLRRANGYFIYSTVEGVSFQPRDIPVGPLVADLQDLIPGLQEVLLGMKPGGKVRAVLPPSRAYEAAPGALPQMPTFATARQLENHRREPLQFEVQLLRVLPKQGA